MAITQADIADLSNVSRVAVSQVLRNPEHPRFSPETRQRILDAAHSLGYVPNRLAAGLRDRKTGTLALVMPFNVPQLMDTIEQEANRLGYALLIQFTFQPDLEAEVRAMQTVLERQVDGVIWQPIAEADKYDDLTTKLVHSNTSVVLLERDLPQLPDATVVRNDVLAGTKLSFNHLKEQGYENIIYLSSRPNYLLRKSSTKAISKLDDNVVMISIAEYEDELSALRKVLTTMKRPLGVYCDNDWMAIRLCQQLENQQANCPNDVGVITFGDMLIGNEFYVGELTCPTITAIRSNEGEIGKQCLINLVGCLDQKNSPKDEINDTVNYGKDIAIATELIVRQSTKRLNNK